MDDVEDKPAADKPQLEFPHSMMNKNVHIRTPTTWYDGKFVAVKTFGDANFLQLEVSSSTTGPVTIQYVNSNFIESIKEK